MVRAPNVRSLLYVLAGLFFLTPAAEAQSVATPGLSVGAAVGGSLDGDLTPGLAVNTVLESGLLYGLQIEYGFGRGGFSIRAGGTYASRYLDDQSAKFDVVGADLGGVFRLPILRSAERLLPFGALTAGATMYSAVPGSPIFGRGVFGPDPVYRFNATVSLGADYLFTQKVAARLEVGDRVTFPSIGESPATDGVPMAHAPVALLGVRYHFTAASGMRSSRRAEAPRPAPAPEPEPRPEPEPAPQPEPEAAEPEAAPAQPAVEAAEEAVFTVQVGTFLTPSTARRWGQRIEEQGLPVWYLDRELGGTEVSRIHAGAVATQEAAARLAAILATQFGWQTEVQRIGPNEAVPANAASMTRAFLEGQ